MDLLAYAATFAVIVALPGPVVAIVVVRTLAGDIRAAVLFTAGIIAGDLVALGVAAGGLGLVLTQAEGPFLLVKVLGLAYLAWIALSLWIGTAAPAPDGTRPRRRDLGEAGLGLAVSLSSPYNILFYLSILPTIAGPDGVARAEIPSLAAITVLVGAGVHALYILLAARMQRMLRDDRLRVVTERTLASLLGGATVWLAMG